MSSFDRFGSRFDPVPAEVALRLAGIERLAGQADLYRNQMPRLLEVLRDRARVDSVEASSAIEGVTAPHARAAAVIRNPEEKPRNRSEAELKGYSNALNYAFERSTTERVVNVGFILHLHRLLYEPAGVSVAGHFKTADNIVVERAASGLRSVRFTPVSSAGTPGAVEDLIGSYEDAVKRASQHPLLLIAGFVLDFTVIHPFADGNGRLSRLLTNFMLDRAGYDVGRYVSVERQIEQTKERYYDALLASTHGWHDNAHDVWPWTSYFVEILSKAYESFGAHADEERSHGSKQERVRDHLERHGAKEFTLSDLRRALPGISDATLRLVLRNLRDQGLVTTTTGRGASWKWKGSK
jgi:Fic family protein